MKKNDFQWTKSQICHTYSNSAFYCIKTGDFEFLQISVKQKALGFASGFLLHQNVWKVKINYLFIVKCGIIQYLFNTSLIISNLFVYHFHARVFICPGMGICLHLPWRSV